MYKNTIQFQENWMALCNPEQYYVVFTSIEARSEAKLSWKKKRKFDTTTHTVFPPWAMWCNEKAGNTAKSDLLDQLKKPNKPVSFPGGESINSSTVGRSNELVWLRRGLFSWAGSLLAKFTAKFYTLASFQGSVGTQIYTMYSRIEPC